MSMCCFWDHRAPMKYHTGTPADNTALVLKVGEVGDTGHVFPNETILVHRVDCGYDAAPAVDTEMLFEDSPDDSSYTARQRWPIGGAGVSRLIFDPPLEIAKGLTGRFTLSAGGAGNRGFSNLQYRAVRSMDGTG